MTEASNNSLHITPVLKYLHHCPFEPIILFLHKTYQSMCCCVNTAEEQHVTTGIHHRKAEANKDLLRVEDK